jgi:5-amino-6-(5-phospho-D-ribitylamino)uracil phosphatase
MQKPHYPILALDLDGTIVRMGKDINPLDLQAVVKYQKAGGVIILASGRPPRSLKNYVYELNTCGWIVASGGALVLNVYTNQTLIDKRLDKVVAINIIKVIRTIPGVEMSMEAGNEFYTDQEYQWVTDIKSDGYLIAGIGPLEGFLNDSVHKIIASTDQLDYQSFAGLLHQTFGDTITITSSYRNLMEITAAKVNKLFGIEPVLANLGYTMHQLAAIGDHRNDTELIQEAGIGAAIGNAIEELKMVADVIVADVDNGGVAEFINLIME